MAALLGAVVRSERMVSAVRFWFLRPMWRRDADMDSLSKSSSSKIFLRDGSNGGVARGARSGTMSLLCLLFS